MRTTTFTLVTTLALAAAVHAQRPSAYPPGHILETTGIDWNREQLVWPQARSAGFRARENAAAAISVQRVAARVEIVEQVARTVLDVEVHNPGRAIAEAVLVLPVPGGAAVTGFDFEGAAAEPTAQLLSAAVAREQYDAIVAKLRDPALLEFAGYDLVQSSVFPVPAQGTQRVRLTFEQLLASDDGRIDYVLPRSESLAARYPWSFEVSVKSKAEIGTVYSPSHDLEVVTQSARRVTLRSRGTGDDAPGAFRFSYLLQRGDLAASLLACPDVDGDGGYFLLLAGLGVHAGATPFPRREVTLVLDRSGSMGGEKFDQARSAALQVLEGLVPGEAFNIVDYSDRVASFAPRAVNKNQESILAARGYLAGLTTGGGTNIDGALAEALAPTPLDRHLPLVLFLTDGLPTVGVKDEATLKARALAANQHERRLFTFGVGFDVNVPLLDTLADASRAKSTYVLPGEDVEVAVGQVFRRLAGPLLTDLALEVDQGDWRTSHILRDLYPQRLPDLFEGDQLVVLGRYTSRHVPIQIVISGDQGGERKRFALRCDFEQATRKNDFVPRLWASRRIAFLMDEIRQAGADPATALAMKDDPRWNELAEEVLTLSTRFGVLSEYTAFLALEGTDLGDWRGLNSIAAGNLIERGANTRSGGAAVNQGRNWNELRGNSRVAYDNGYWDAGNSRVSMVDVQPLADRVMFRRGGRWIDGHALGAGATPEPDEEIEFGSAAHAELVRELAVTRRGGLLSLPGEVLLRLDGRNVLVRNGAPEEADAPQR